MQTLSPAGIEPREYQTAIAKSAQEANTLVVLPTGLGKTIIALLVAVERLGKHPNSKVLILAPTRPLVLQHSNFFAEHYPDKSTKPIFLTGEVPPPTRASDFDEGKLIFATPEVIRNDVLAGRYDLRNVSLIVFDEAHRCVRDYAYSDVAQAYRSQAERPLILGLTASPSAKKTRVEEICEKLAITNVETRTEKDVDVSEYVKEVEVVWERLSLPAGYKGVSKVLHAALDVRLNKLRVMHHLPPSNVQVSRRMLLELGEKLHNSLRRGASGAIFGAVQLQSQAMSLMHAIDLLETQGAYSAERFLSKLDRAKTKSARGLARDSQVIEAQKLAASLDSPHPKELKLREIVSEDLKSNSRAKIIVFTQFRDTVETIANNLNKIDLVQAVRFVGQATRSEEDIGLSQSEQMQILEDFRDGKYNILVTTSIGEEGLHVPDVDHVIFYEAVPSEIRMIQRRGRTGRTRPGKTTVLMTEGTVDEAYYWTSRRKEEQMHRYLATVKNRGVRRTTKKKTTLLDYVATA